MDRSLIKKRAQAFVRRAGRRRSRRAREARAATRTHDFILAVRISGQAGRHVGGGPPLPSGHRGIRQGGAYKNAIAVCKKILRFKGSPDPSPLGELYAGRPRRRAGSLPRIRRRLNPRHGSKPPSMRSSRSSSCRPTTTTPGEVRGDLDARGFPERGGKTPPPSGWTSAASSQAAQLRERASTLAPGLEPGGERAAPASETGERRRDTPVGGLERAVWRCGSDPSARPGAGQVCRMGSRAPGSRAPTDHATKLPRPRTPPAAYRPTSLAGDRHGPWGSISAPGRSSGRRRAWKGAELAFFRLTWRAGAPPRIPAPDPAQPRARASTDGRHHHAGRGARGEAKAG